MIDAVPSCEWNPGSNRSLVDPVVAVAKLDMPAPMRATLIEKMQRHQFDDVVRIRWATIESETGANQYDATIANMNFGRDGRLCKTVTRNQWKADHEEGAIVYIVDGRAFGYAAVCGNLFELVRREPPVAARDIPELYLPAQPVVSAPMLPDPELSQPGVPVPDMSTLAVAGPALITAAFAPPIFFGTSVVVVPPVTPPIPEPSVWALLGAGLLLVWRRVAR